MAQWIGRRISDQGVPGSIPRRCTFRCGLEQVTFTLCLVLVKPRKRWTDDRLGQTVTRLEITLCLMCKSPRDLVSRPDIMDETVQHTRMRSHGAGSRSSIVLFNIYIFTYDAD